MHTDPNSPKSFDAATSLDTHSELTAAALADTLTGAPKMIATDTASQSQLWLEPPTYITSKKLAVRCRCEATNPLVSGSPGISYSITITIDKTLGTYSITGTHDGFPAYEIYINGKRVYQHDPLATGDGLGSLGLDEEYDVNENASHLNIPLP